MTDEVAATIWTRNVRSSPRSSARTAGSGAGSPFSQLSTVSRWTICTLRRNGSIGRAGVTIGDIFPQGLHLRFALKPLCCLPRTAGMPPVQNDNDDLHVLDCSSSIGDPPMPAT